MKQKFILLIFIFLSQKSFGSFDSYIVKRKNKNITVEKNIPSSFIDDIEYVEPNNILKLDIEASSLPANPKGWHLNKIGMNNVSEKLTKNSKTLVIAVIDSGMEWTHPDLQAHLYTNLNEIPDNGIDDDGNGFVDDVHGFNFIDNNGKSNDDNGHGTHVSGVIGADCNKSVGTCGIMRNVKIMPLKFLNKDGKGDTASAVNAINYAVKMNVDIINASWGSAENSKALFDAITNAQNRGIIFVTASGNYRNNNDLNPMYPSSFSLNNIISVAATDSQDQLDDFSNFGGRSVHVAAPGKDILSTYIGGKYETLSGTSMATPIVTGMMGLLKQAHPENNINYLKAALINSCDQSIDLVNDVICHGRVNISKSLDFLAR